MKNIYKVKNIYSTNKSSFMLLLLHPKSICRISSLPQNQRGHHPTSGGNRVGEQGVRTAWTEQLLWKSIEACGSETMAKMSFPETHFQPLIGSVERLCACFAKVIALSKLFTLPAPRPDSHRPSPHLPSRPSSQSTKYLHPPTP